MISFKDLEEKDFAILTKWLNLDFVTKWYEKRKFSFSDVEVKFGPRIRSEEPTRSFMIYEGDTPIGYIQYYKIHDYPDYARCVDVDEHTVGLDLFIGDKNFIHKGYGKVIMKQFLKSFVFCYESIQSCIVGPEPSNKAAIRMYEKAGFTHLKTVKCEGESDAEYLMVYYRRQLNEVVFMRA